MPRRGAGDQNEIGDCPQIPGWKPDWRLPCRLRIVIHAAVAPSGAGAGNGPALSTKPEGADAEQPDRHRLGVGEGRRGPMRPWSPGYSIAPGSSRRDNGVACPALGLLPLSSGKQHWSDSIENSELCQQQTCEATVLGCCALGDRPRRSS